MRTFTLDSLPLQLKKKVVEKMSIDALCKFRRTSKENEQFVRENRRFLRPEMKGTYNLAIGPSETDSISLRISNIRFPPVMVYLAWEERWELLGIKSLLQLDMCKLSSDVFGEMLAPFLKKLVPKEDHLDVGCLLLISMDLENVQDILNAFNAREVECYYQRGLLLKFIQQWQTDQRCQFERVEGDLTTSDENTLLDAGFEKVWDPFCDDSFLESCYIQERVEAIYSIRRNLDVAGLGQNGVLFVYEEDVCFFPCTVGATIKESLMNELEDQWSCDPYDYDNWSSDEAGWLSEEWSIDSDCD